MNLVQRKHYLQGIPVTNVIYREMDFSHTRAFGAKWTGSYFTDCRFDLSEMGNVTFEGCHFVRCSMMLAALGPSRFISCTFSQCNLENSSFQGSWMTDVRFHDCRMQYVNLAGAQLEKVSFVQCNVRWADLTFASVEDVSWDRANIWGAKVNLGCSFFRASFDDKWRRRFAGLLAWSWPEGAERRELERIAGRHMEAICHLMEGGTEDAESKERRG